MAVNRENSVAINLNFHKEKDKDLIEWLKAMNNRSATVRIILRNYMDHGFANKAMVDTQVTRLAPEDLEDFENQCENL